MLKLIHPVFQFVSVQFFAPSCLFSFLWGGFPVWEDIRLLPPPPPPLQADVFPCLCSWLTWRRHSYHSCWPDTVTVTHHFPPTSSLRKHARSTHALSWWVTEYVCICESLRVRGRVTKQSYATFPKSWVTEWRRVCNWHTVNSWVFSEGQHIILIQW